MAKLKKNSFQSRIQFLKTKISIPKSKTKINQRIQIHSSKIQIPSESKIQNLNSKKPKAKIKFQNPNHSKSSEFQNPKPKWPKSKNTVSNPESNSSKLISQIPNSKIKIYQRIQIHSSNIQIPSESKIQNLNSKKNKGRNPNSKIQITKFKTQCP